MPSRLPTLSALLLLVQAGGCGAVEVPPLEVEGVRYNLVRIPAGEDVLGSPPTEAGRTPQEDLRRVRIARPFDLGRTEVPQALWNRVMPTNPSRFVDPDRPVDSLTWDLAVAFCNRLSEREGLPPAYEGQGDSLRFDPQSPGWRLPTEDEWEYAARAGTETLYAGSDDPTRVAWFQMNSGHTTHPVGQKAPNRWGLFDLTGNVEECVWTDANPGANKGGAMGNEARHIRVANRHHLDPTRSFLPLGMRLARNAREAP